MTLNREIEQFRKRIFELEGRVEYLHNYLVAAVDYFVSDPQSSLTKCRIVFEKLLFNLFVQEMKAHPKKKMIGSMLSNRKFVEKLPRRIVVRMISIRDMANLGPHGGNVESEDALRTLRDLLDVLDWYISEYEFAEATMQSTLTAFGKAETIEILPHLKENYPDYISEDTLSVKFGQSIQHCFLEITKASIYRSGLVDEKINRYDLGYIVDDIDIESDIDIPYFDVETTIAENSEKFIRDFESLWMGLPSF